MLRRKPQRLRDDAGLTLIELLISTSLLSLVVSAVGAAVILGLNATGRAQHDFSAANARNLPSRQFLLDIQGALTVTPLAQDSPSINCSPQTETPLFNIERPSERIEYTLAQSQTGATCNVLRNNKPMIRGIRQKRSATIRVDPNGATSLEVFLVDDKETEPSFHLTASPRAEARF